MTLTTNRPGSPMPSTLRSPDGPAPVATPATAPARVDRFETEGAARSFEVLFTPNDDALGFEARCIDDVIAARRADPNVYPPSENPYRILYAVFNLRNKEIAEKLFQASKEGVQVQVLVEADQVAADRPWNKLAGWFEERGLSVLRSDKDVDDAQRRGAHLIGIDKASLMHMKSRVFRYKDPETGEPRSKVLSGSLNPGGAPVTNEENLNVMVDPRIVDRYEKRFFEIRDRTLATNTWDDTQPVNVLFTPYETGSVTPTEKLFRWIDDEDELILISVFQLHDLKARGGQESLLDKLKKAQARGVTVMAITDRRKSDGTDEHGNRVMMYGRPAHDDNTDEAFAAAGIPVFELVNTANEFSAIHGKSVVFGLDDMKVMTDAGNWTVAAMGSDTANPKNEESFLFVDSKTLDGNATGRAYLSNFLHLLRKYDGQFPEAAEEVIRKLQRLPTWPKVSVDLGPLARAHPGQDVYLVSDHPDVVARTPAGAPGIPIPSAPSSGSPPFRPPEPLSLPLGTMLSYRVAVKDPATGRVVVPTGDQVLVVEK